MSGGPVHIQCRLPALCCGEGTSLWYSTGLRFQGLGFFKACPSAFSLSVCLSCAAEGHCKSSHRVCLYSSPESLRTSHPSLYPQLFILVSLWALLTWGPCILSPRTRQKHFCLCQKTQINFYCERMKCAVFLCSRSATAVHRALQ